MLRHPLVITVHSSLSALQLPLELSQSFVRNADGSYSRFHCPDPPPEPEGYRPQAIRPMELRTFLKVGEWPLWLHGHVVLHCADAGPLCLWQDRAQQIRRRPVRSWSSGSQTFSLAVTWASSGSALNSAASRAVRRRTVRERLRQRKEVVTSRTQPRPNPGRMLKSFRWLSNVSSVSSSQC